MLHYDNIATCKAPFISHINTRLCNIFNFFTCYCKEHISVSKIFFA